MKRIALLILTNLAVMVVLSIVVSVLGVNRYLTANGLIFGILASMIVMYFSRQREFRADAGAAKLLGTPRPMIAALQRLGGMSPEPLPSNMATAGIAGKGGVMSLFATHPSIEERVAALAGQ
jgi:heat shock protein HtpX